MRKWVVVSGLLAGCGLVWGIAAHVARAGVPAPAGDRPLLREAVTVVAAHPLREGVCYTGSTRGVWTSEDDGARWRWLSSFRGAILYDLAIASSSPAILYAATSHGLYRSDDEGRRWQLRRADAGEATPDVLAVAVHPTNPAIVAIGTRRQVLVSRDGGRSWRPGVGVPESPIHAALYQPMTPEALWVAAATGLYRSADGGVSWNRVLVRSGGDDPDAADGPGLDDGEPNPADGGFGALAMDPGQPRRLVVSLGRRAWRSEDAGATWQPLSSIGLGHPAIRHLLIAPGDPDHLYAATSGGLFVFSCAWQAWRPLTEGLPTTDIRRLCWVPKPPRVWAATAAGLFRVPIPVPLGGAPGIVPPPRAQEPTIHDVQVAAIRYAEVMPEKIRNWRARAAWRAWVPRFTLSVDRDTNTTIGSSSSSGKTTFTVGPDDRSVSFGYGFTWDLANLIWNPDQTSIDVRSRLMVQLRNDVLDEVTRVYFERRRLQVEEAMAPVHEPSLRAERQLRIEELTAQLDALTGGDFSEALVQHGSRPLAAADY